MLMIIIESEHCLCLRPVVPKMSVYGFQLNMCVLNGEG